MVVYRQGQRCWERLGLSSDDGCTDRCGVKHHQLYLIPTLCLSHHRAIFHHGVACASEQIALGSPHLDANDRKASWRDWRLWQLWCASVLDHKAGNSSECADTGRDDHDGGRVRHFNLRN